MSYRVRALACGNSKCIGPQVGGSSAHSRQPKEVFVADAVNERKNGRQWGQKGGIKPVHVQTYRPL